VSPGNGSEAARALSSVTQGPPEAGGMGIDGVPVSPQAGTGRTQRATKAPDLRSMTQCPPVEDIVGLDPHTSSIAGVHVPASPHVSSPLHGLPSLHVDLPGVQYISIGTLWQLPERHTWPDGQPSVSAQPCRFPALGPTHSAREHASPSANAESGPERTSLSQLAHSLCTGSYLHPLVPPLPMAHSPCGSQMSRVHEAMSSHRPSSGVFSQRPLEVQRSTVQSMPSSQLPWFGRVRHSPESPSQ
jgi:hypothetical protein